MKLTDIKPIINESDVEFTDNQDKLDWLESYLVALDQRDDFLDKRDRVLYKEGILGNGVYTNGKYVPPAGYTMVRMPSKWAEGDTKEIAVRNDKANDSQFMERLRNLYLRLQKTNAIQQQVKKQIKYARKDVARDKLAAVDTGRKKSSASQEPVDPKQHPLHIAAWRRAPRTVGRRRGRGGVRVPGRLTYITNPIRESGATDLYVGPPLDYPDLSTPMKLVFVQVDELLKELGHEGLNVIYGARVNGAITFLAIGAGGKVKWYKRSKPLSNMLILSETAYDANYFLKRTKQKRLDELKIYIGYGPNHPSNKKEENKWPPV